MPKILYIEDDKIDALLITKQLEDLNSEYSKFIHLAQNKNEFLDFINNNKVDLIISDYKIDIDFTGLDVINIVRDKGYDIPIIILTGAIGEEKAAELMRAGATDLVLKENIEKLDQVIDRELKNIYYKMDQIQVMKKVNTILFKLAKAVKWIMQHHLDEISFERILSDFVNLLNVDRGYICEKNGEYTLRYVYCNDDACSHIENITGFKVISLNDEDFILNKIEERKTVYGNIKSFDNLSNSFILKSETKSFAIIPILKPDKTIWGFICFDDMERERQWTELEINTLEMLAAILGTIVYKIELKNKEDELINQQVNLLKDARESIMSYLQEKKE